jgi:hypothetical protein
MRRPVLLLMATLLLAGCGGGVAFHVDDPLTGSGSVDLEPRPLPLVLSWEDPDSGLAAALEAQQRYYVVFVDRAPIAPGSNLATLVDTDCERSQGCPNREWFADEGVHITRQPALVLQALVDARTSERVDAQDRHVATVVVADASGTRVGEGAITIPFLVQRAGTR